MSKRIPIMRVDAYIRAKLFYIVYRLFFKQLHWSSRIDSPASVEGAEFIAVGRRTLIAKHSAICASDVLHNSPTLEIGSDVKIGKFNHIYATKKIVIHNRVLTANNVYISDNQHDYSSIAIPIIDQPILQKGEVEIHEGAWIGQNSCIIGCNIGRNSVVAAGSVVINDVPDYCVVAGTPARIVKRFCLEKLLWEKI